MTIRDLLLLTALATALGWLGTSTVTLAVHAARMEIPE